jgi:hypothetical protein
LYRWVLIAFVLTGSFVVWRDEHKAAEAARSEVISLKNSETTATNEIRQGKSHREKTAHTQVADIFCASAAIWCAVHFTNSDGVSSLHLESRL